METLKKDFLPWRELKILLSYIAAHLIFLNGQRPAAVRYMTLNEYNYHIKTPDGRYCIKVAHHKTMGTYGPVKLLVNQKVLN